MVNLMRKIIFTIMVSQGIQQGLILDLSLGIRDLEKRNMNSLKQKTDLMEIMLITLRLVSVHCTIRITIQFIKAIGKMISQTALVHYFKMANLNSEHFGKMVMLNVILRFKQFQNDLMQNEFQSHIQTIKYRSYISTQIINLCLQLKNQVLVNFNHLLLQVLVVPHFLNIQIAQIDVQNFILIYILLSLNFLLNIQRKFHSGTLVFQSLFEVHYRRFFQFYSNRIIINSMNLYAHNHHNDRNCYPNLSIFFCIFLTQLWFLELHIHNTILFLFQLNRQNHSAMLFFILIPTESGFTVRTICIFLLQYFIFQFQFFHL